MASPSASRPRVLPWAALALTLLLVLRSLGMLLAQVQLASGAAFGDLEALASGPSLDFVAETQALLTMWQEAAAAEPVRALIRWTTGAYTGLDLAFAAVYATLLVQLWRRVRGHLPAYPQGSEAEWSRLRRWAHLASLPYLAIAAAGADVVEDVLRLVMVLRATAGAAVPGWLIWLSWVATTLKFALLAVFAVFLVVLVVDTRKLRAWLKRMWWATWRLRVAVVAVGLFAGAVLFDVTGQAIDLVRRWVDSRADLFSGVLTLLGSALLGLAAWLMARRLVLARHRSQAPDRVPWAFWLGGVAVAAAAGAFFLGWTELWATAALAVVLLALGMLWRQRVPEPVRGRMTQAAQESRESDAERPQDADALGGRHAARLLAIAPPVTMLIVAATAYAPVLVILPLSGEAGTARFVLACVITAAAVAGAPLVAVGGWAMLARWDGGLDKTPIPFEKKYAVGALGVGLAAAASIAAAVTHVRFVGALLVVSTFLAAVMLLLGEAQRWSETHGAPPGLLVLGFTRVPVSALLAGLLVLASFWLGDGAEHAVHRQRTLPAALSGQVGVGLEQAFGAWVAGNCAGPGTSGRQVPLFLVAAPGGGLRAAYWTSSTLTDLFGVSRKETVPGCAAAKSDRIFAIGGASGGSLGALAYAAGLDSDRGPAWFDEQVGRPDFLTDPLTWMLTVDLARGYVGYGGQDRARRLEDGFARHITGLGDDFFAGQWGLGGRTPLMLLTGTQVESGCRLNISGLRLTDLAGRSAGGGCTAIGHGAARLDAPVTTDILDVLCGQDGQSARSLSRSTAAVLSARFPYVSPSGQLYGCGSAPGAPTAVVDGGYAENTGLGMLLALWPRLLTLISAHNAAAGNAQIVPVLLEISNGYARVAAPRVSGRTVEGLVPTSTRARPDALDERALEQQAAAAFAGRVPGSPLACDIAPGEGRFLVISPRISPGLPAPLAWSLSTLATDDLRAQRDRALQTIGPAVHAWASSNVSCLVSAPAAS